MRRILSVLIAALVMGTTTARGEAPRPPATTITFQSSTYSDFGQILRREQPTGSVTLKARLEFPEEARDRYPLVIVAHTLSGYRDVNEGYAAAEMRKSGFATLTYDSFASRGTTGMALSASPAYLPAGVTDAYAALRRLADEPRIDINRVAVLGFSFGADVAHLTALELLRSALDPGQRFAAHVAFYPAGSIGAIADDRAYTGSPVLMLLGEKDDNLPVAKMEGYLAYARTAGHSAPIEVVTYPGAVHAWTVSDLTKPRFYPDYLSTKKCPVLLLRQGPPMFLIGGEVKPFDPNALAACMREAPGYTMGFNAAARAQSFTDAARFLQKNLRP